jgi:hypothetical protein
MYGALQLAQWIRGGGRAERRSFGHSAKLAWHARWFELNWKSEERRLASLALPDDPVFILGLWRSGTTVLHELLAACTKWTTPQTWQCFHPSTCFLTKAPATDAEVGRPMDQGRITSLGPQEDEFALLLLGEPSAYRAFIDPRRFDECAALLWPENQGPLPRWQTFLRGIAATPGGSRVLLKSPGHSFRVPMLRAAFPRAKFIWAGRQTGEMLASNTRMWRAMIDQYAFWSCPEGALEAFLQQALRAGGGALERCLNEVPREAMLWVDFEELGENPRGLLERVFRFLNAGGPPTVTPSIDQALARVKIHAGATRATLPADPEAAQFQERMAAAREFFGPRD